jgi:hypothetical protein
MNKKAALAIAAVLLLMIGIGVANWQYVVYRWQLLLTATVVFALFVAGSAWFIWCFTGDALERRTHAIVFSYFFTLLALAVTLVGATVVSVTQLPQEKMRESPIGVAAGCVVGADDQGTSGELACDGSAGQWLLNIGGWVENPKDTSPPYKIRGGLVVPLYFVILSLMGGAVSLARRVPEIQKRSENDYVATEKEPKLSPSDVREHLAFQIMQFVSAPLIALTAYYLIAPGSRATSAALGFSSGFASEAILLLIRGVVEKVSPQGTPPPRTGAASGNVRRGGAAAPNATVAVVGHPALRSQTDGNGGFVINGVPIGEQVVEASDQGGARLAKVIVEAGRATACQIDL